MLTDQAAAANAKSARRQRPQSLSAVGVANGAGEGVGGVGRGCSGQGEQAHDHRLHLLLGGFALADDRLLDLQGGVFGDRQAAVHQRRNGGAARLAEQ